MHFAPKGLYKLAQGQRSATLGQEVCPRIFYTLKGLYNGSLFLFCQGLVERAGAEALQVNCYVLKAQFL